MSLDLNKKELIQDIIDRNNNNGTLSEELEYLCIDLLTEEQWNKFDLGKRSDQTVSKYVEDCKNNGTLEEALSYVLNLFDVETLECELY